MKFVKTLVTAQEPQRVNPYTYSISTAETVQIPTQSNRIINTGLKLVEAPELQVNKAYDNQIMGVIKINNIPGIAVKRKLLVLPTEAPFGEDIRVIVYNLSRDRQTLIEGMTIAYLQVQDFILFEAGV